MYLPCNTSPSAVDVKSAKNDFFIARCKRFLTKIDGCEDYGFVGVI